MSIATATKNTTDTQTDFLPLHGTDYVEFYGQCQAGRPFL
jgi:hypothetical protein